MPEARHQVTIGRPVADVFAFVAFVAIAGPVRPKGEYQAALLTGAAAILAVVAIAAALVSESMGLWWADAAGSVLIAAVLAREGWASVGWGRETARPRRLD
jgi:hypothetical protein